MQIAHDARDSICVNAVDRFNAFLTQHPETPDSTVELQRRALIKLGKPSFLDRAPPRATLLQKQLTPVVTDNSDPDRVGTFVRWRIAFYAAGDVTALHNLMYLLDGWWTYSFKDKPQRENVHLHPHINVDIDATWDNLEYQACLFSLSPLRSSLSGGHP